MFSFDFLRHYNVPRNTGGNQILRCTLRSLATRTDQTFKVVERQKRLLINSEHA
jgi:hypothetical protein